MDATTVAVDLAKDVFQVTFANRAGRIIDRQRLTRRQFERLLDGMLARIVWAVCRADDVFHAKPRLTAAA